MFDFFNYCFTFVCNTMYAVSSILIIKSYGVWGKTDNCDSYKTIYATWLRIYDHSTDFYVLLLLQQKNLDSFQLNNKCRADYLFIVKPHGVFKPE